MGVTISQVVVVVMGGAVLLLSVWGIALPQKLVAMVKGVMDRPGGMHVAVVARIVLGIALITAASVSKVPAVFQVIGWLSIAAAVALPIIGSPRIRALVGWFEGVGPTFVRVWLVFGMIFGGLLVYGII